MEVLPASHGQQGKGYQLASQMMYTTSSYGFLLRKRNVHDVCFHYLLDTSLERNHVFLEVQCSCWRGLAPAATWLEQHVHFVEVKK